MLKNRIIAIGGLLLGIPFIGFSLYMTHGTYHPLPPGQPHIDGRGLFAPLFITPIASIGGILVAKSVMAINQSPVWRTVRLCLYSLSAIAAVSLPVTYMLFFTGPDMSSTLSDYYDWYMFSPILSALSVLAEEMVTWWVSRYGD